MHGELIVAARDFVDRQRARGRQQAECGYCGRPVTLLRFGHVPSHHEWRVNRDGPYQAINKCPGSGGYAA